MSVDKYPGYLDVKKAGRIAANCLVYLKGLIIPGMTTLDIDKFAESYLRSRNLVPPLIEFLNFGHTLCVSVNEEICHGVPSNSKILQVGDVIKLDIVVGVNDYYADTAITFILGQEDDINIRLAIEVLENSIKVVEPRRSITLISNKIFTLAGLYDFDVLRGFSGHTIGTNIHMEPLIPNRPDFKQSERLQEGQFIAIEPLLAKVGALKTTGYHFEHTVLVTDRGYEIMTLPGPDIDWQDDLILMEGKV